MKDKRRFRTRAVFLAVVWILLLLLSLSLLSVLSSSFLHNPQGENISSLSWAGYIISRTTDAQAGVTAINASWAVPVVNASAGNSYSSVWVGIGGELDQTLIQVGTENAVSSGQATYYAWYELLPNFAVVINTLTVSSGDVMVASITLLNSATNQWNIHISDTTTGQDFSLNVSYNSTRSSGEWVLERPTMNNKLTTLADFGSVTFADCYLNANNISGAISRFYYLRLEMTNDLNNPLTSVSNLAANGTSFTVSYVPTH
ncbi:MAG: G1 family glutamic endopeptidase [Candidatus Bathyarchaeia archaeon]